MSTNFKKALNNDKAEWRTRLAYKCGICGAEFESVADRANCELKCFKAQEEEKRLAAAKKKQEEQAARKKEVDEAIAHADELKRKYIKDYGAYVRVSTCHADELDEALSFADFFRMLP